MKKLFFTWIFVFICTFYVIAEESNIPVIQELSPPEAKVSERITIKGSNFSPEKDKNTVWFGSEKAQVLEASSESLVVIVPEIKKGCAVSVEVMGKKSQDISFRLLPYLEFVLSDKNITAGKKTVGIVRVKGSKKPWKIRVINKYYQVIDLIGGNEQDVITSGGDDNKVELEIMAKQKGNFSLMCKKLEELDEAAGSISSSQKNPIQALEPSSDKSSIEKSGDSAPKRGSPEGKDKEPDMTAKTHKKNSNVASGSNIGEDTTTAEKDKEKPPVATKNKDKIPLATENKEGSTVVIKDSAETSSDSIYEKYEKEIVDRNNAPNGGNDKTTSIPGDVQGGDKKKISVPNTKSDKNEVLAYCNKLKQKIDGKRSELLKLQKQIENKTFEYGKRKGVDSVQSKEKISDINVRGKRILLRIDQIEKELQELKADPEKNKTKIENLRSERSKLYQEQKNMRTWKKDIVSQPSKATTALKTELNKLIERREVLQREIDKLQKEYENKLKSLVT